MQQCHGTARNQLTFDPMILARGIDAQDARFSCESSQSLGQIDFSPQQVAVGNDLGGRLVELSKRGLKQPGSPVLRIAKQQPSRPVIPKPR
jgi:hypothetical protein